MSFDKMFKEIFLLPAVKGLVKCRLKIEVFGWSSVEKFVELLESGAVVGLALFKRSILKAEEILIA